MRGPPIPDSALHPNINRTKAIRPGDPSVAGILPDLDTPKTLLLNCLIDGGAYDISCAIKKNGRETVTE